MSRKFFALALQVGVIVLVFAGGAHAQTTSGLITGTITDSTGAVIPGAHVQLANQATGIQRSAVTDANGYYSVPELPPGVYDVTVNKEGFASQNLANVHLEVNQSEALNFKMGVTASTQTVQVNADIQQINTTSATLGEIESENCFFESRYVFQHSYTCRNT